MEQRPKFNLHAFYLSICNLNFLGIGYLLAGLKKRWMIALGGNLVLLLAAQFANSSKQPLVWALVFFVVFAGMAIDLWFLIKKDPQLVPVKLTTKTFLLPMITAAILLVFFGGFFAYRTAGEKLIANGRTAYEEGDYQAAFKNLYSTAQLYRLSLNPEVVAIEPELNEVSVIVSAQDYAAQKAYENTLKAVEKFHEFFPDSPKTSLMNNLAIDTNLAWAMDLQAGADYQACLDHFKIILADYPKEADERKTEIDEAMADNYLKWGKSLSMSKDYNTAIEKLETVVHSYVNTQSYAEAYGVAAQTHYDMALSLADNNDFSGAETHLLLIQTDYINADVLKDAVNEMPKILLAWGVYLRDNQFYLDAITKFDQVADYSSDSDLLTQAETGKSETIPLLARDNGSDGAFVIELALQKACMETTVDDPSIDLFPEEQGKALSCDDYNASYVPTELTADIPGTFRYVVSFIDANRRVQSCQYLTSSDSRTLERWQYGKTVIITSVKSGKKFAEKTFYGSAPESCPAEYWFSYMTEETWGGYYEDVKIQDWLSTVLK